MPIFSSLLVRQIFVVDANTMYERKVRIAFFYRTFCASFTLTHTHTSGILKRRKERMERKVERIGNDKMNEDGHWENFLHSLRSDGIYIYEEKIGNKMK